MRNPNWTREELILALDVYMSHRDALPMENSATILALSLDVRSLALALGLQRADERFRSPGAAHGKLENFKRFDPGYGHVGLPAGGKLDEEIWNEFAGNIGELKWQADLIRRQLGFASRVVQTSVPEDESFPEGRLTQRLHYARERNPRLAQKKKQKALAENGRLNCEICDFDFEKTYGDFGRGFIECHHLIPVAEWPEQDGLRTRLRDTILVCSNCHRMLHRRRPWPTASELREFMQQEGMHSKG